MGNRPTLRNESMEPGLLMFSGGIDSTYVLYKTLQTGRHLHVHHINLVNREGRSGAEQRAVKRILAWMRKQGLNNFTYSENTFDYGSIRFIVKDYCVYALHIGMILSDPMHRRIKSFLHARHSDGFHLRKGQTFEGASARSNSVLLGISEIVARRRPRMELPMVHMTKAEVIADMPVDLLQLTWHCRRPLKTGSTYSTCGTCHTCRQVAAASRKAIRS